MSPPMTAAQFLQAFLDEGVHIVEVGPWETHNRNHMGPWGPMHGVMIHHTVTSGSAHTVEMCRKGYTSLPGPLCHGVITKDGKVHLVGYGRANHAGLGDPDVLAAVINEQPVPVDDQATVDGNRHFYGFECENLGDGRDPWPDAQIEAIVRVITALCRRHNWAARSAIRHMDWQPGKVDPRGPGLDWDSVLVRVAARLAGAAPGTPDPQVPAPLPRPRRPVVDLSRLVAAARSNPAAAGTPVTYAGVRTVEAALVDAGLLVKRYADGHYGTTTIAAYAAWQQRLGYRGDDADGIPGRTSLTRLGDKYGFDITP